VEDDVAGGYFGLDKVPGQRDGRLFTLDTRHQTPDTRHQILDTQHDTQHDTQDSRSMTRIFPSEKRVGNK
jgi:hypothetical protein